MELLQTPEQLDVMDLPDALDLRDGLETPVSLDATDLPDVLVLPD
jgi:hypothetical protein